MSGFAALFPGQLSEQAGMGEALHRAHPYVRERFEEIAGISGVDLAATFFGSGSAALHDDREAQVGVFAVSLAVLEVLEREHGLVPSSAAGYSLGTYAAMVAAGCLSWRDALSALLEVQRLLAERAPAGAMGFVIGLTLEGLAPHLAAVSTDPAVVTVGNENAAQQLVVTGLEEGVDAVLARARPNALRAERLPIRWPMHSPLLGPVVEEVRRFVEGNVEVASPCRARLFAPMLGREVADAAEAAEVLALQLSRPSRWAATLSAMAAAGAERFAELGPGEVLTKMTRWTVRRAEAAALGDPGSIGRFAGVAEAAGRTEEGK